METEKVVDPKKELITITENSVVDEFCIADLETQVNIINAQIKNVKDWSEREIAGLEAERALYIGKINANAYEGYKLPDFETVEEVVEEVVDNIKE